MSQTQLKNYFKNIIKSIKTVYRRAPFTTQAKPINFGSYMKERGLVYQATDQAVFEDNFVDKLKDSHSNFSIYCGFDPTSDSLHLG